MNPGVTAKMRGLALAVLLCAGFTLPACAPVATYRGPVPAPGRIAGFGAAALDADPARLAPRGADLAHHYLGSIALPVGTDSLVMLVYGDNRPGYLIEKHSVEFRAVRRLSWRAPGDYLRGLAFAPLLLIESIVPTLDGPRDLVAHFTRRFSGGSQEPVLRAIERERADLIVNLGDLVQDGRRGRQWEDFAKLHAGLRSKTLYLAAVGNHERTWSLVGRDNWNAVMGSPAAPERYWYAINVPEVGARFVFLDSNVFTDVRDRMPDAFEESLAEEQLAWADSVLDTPLPRRFILFHHPLVSAGHHEADWSSKGAARRRERLFEMATRHRVTAVFTSHEHLYQRSYIRTGDSTGFWHLVTGGAGSPLYAVPPKVRKKALDQPLAPGLTLDRSSVRHERWHHYCRLAIPRTGGASASLPVEVRRVAGNTVTRFDILDLAQPPSTP